MSKFVDLTGRHFGHWEVLDRAQPRGKYSYWACECDCGTKKDVYQGSLTLGKSTNCGCRRAHRHSFKGESLTLQEIADRLEIDPASVRQRIRDNRPLDVPKHFGQSQFLSYQGKTLSIAGWAKEIGLNKHTLAYRLRLGWSVERALKEPVDERRRRRNDKRED